MRHNRREILQALIDNVPPDHPFIGIPYMVIPVDKTVGDETESTRLIEDLEMDSIDIQSMIWDAANQLGMDIYSVPEEKLGRLNTLGDCVDLIQRYGG